MLIGGGSLALLVSVGLFVVLMRGLAGAGVTLPEPVREHIAAFCKEARTGRPARISRVEYMAIKGRAAAPTGRDIFGQVAHDTLAAAESGKLKQWPSGLSGMDEQRRMGMGGTTAVDEKRLRKVLKEMEKQQGGNPPPPPPPPDLRVDGAYLVVFREPVHGGIGIANNEIHSRLIFLMRPGVRFGGPFDICDPDDSGAADWRAVVRGLVTEENQ